MNNTIRMFKWFLWVKKLVYMTEQSGMCVQHGMIKLIKHFNRYNRQIHVNAKETRSVLGHRMVALNLLHRKGVMFSTLLIFLMPYR